MAKGFFSIKSEHKPNYIFLLVSLFLLLAGFIALASASSDIGKIRFNNTYYYLFEQLIKGLIPGLVGFFAGYLIYYRKIKKASLYLFLINLVLLVLVVVPKIGINANGSRRWIGFGSFSFQPSELLKITYILYIASLFSGQRIKKLSNSSGGWKNYGIFFAVSAIVGALIFFEPATTMALVLLVSGMVVYFLSGKSLKQIVSQIILSGAVAILAIIALSIITPYRMARIVPFWNDIAQKFFPSAVVKTENTDTYHLNQALMAIGTGGVSGVGFGNSTSKYSILPEPMGDSIFAVIAEEFGFAGSLVLIFAYFLLFWQSIRIAQKSNDDFARLTVVGFASILAMQTIIHIGANTGLLPYTGVPLPFISYGGTSLAITLTMTGIIANISKY